MEYIVAIIQAVVWPAVVVWLGYIFRSELRALLQRLSKLKYREAEADFNHELGEAEKQTLHIAKIVQRSGAVKQDRSDSDWEIYEQLFRIAAISPKAALLEAWRNVDRTIKELAHNMGIVIESRTPDYRVMEQLIAKANLKDNFIRLFFILRELRNRVAHIPDFEIDQEKAERYLQMTIELIQDLRGMTKELVKKD